MNKLLKIEWLKIKNYTAFKVISIFFIVGVAGVNYIAYIFKKKVIDPADPTGMLSSGSPFEFPKVWLSVSYYGGWLLLLPGLLLLILVTNEYAYRTSRQNIIDGMSRRQFIESKLMMGIIIAAASTVLVIITAIIFGFTQGKSISFEGFENIGYFFLKALTYNFVAILFGVLIKRTGFAIAAFFMYTVLENGISIALFVWAINIKKDSGTDLGNMGNYLPMNASDGLLFSPLSNVSKMASGLLPQDYFGLVFTLAIVYVVLFYVWSRAKFIKSDL
jgi:ABC-2 type transport system permease protein